MPSNKTKFTPQLDGSDYIFLGILTVLGLLCICIVVLLYSEIISNRCSFSTLITPLSISMETLNHVSRPG